MSNRDHVNDTPSNDTPSDDTPSDDRSLPVSGFTLPHERGNLTPATRRTPAATTSAHAGHRDEDADHVARRRNQARRTVSGLSVGLAVAAGVGAGALTYVAQQATTNGTAVLASQTTTDTSTDSTDTSSTTAATSTSSSSAAVTVQSSTAAAAASTHSS